MLELPMKVQLPIRFDQEKLIQDWSLLEEAEWVTHFVKQNYQGDWSVLPLTAQRGREHPILMASAVPGDKDFVLTRFIEKTLYFQWVLDQFHCPKFSIRLMRLGPESEIKEHRDYDLDLEEVRLHIPILTNDQVFFYLNQERVLMQPGECWYLKLSEPHRVVNQSSSPRIHLVMDLGLNDWLEKLICESNN